ncbi:MAG: transposase [Georgfuchsia sp.]
MPRRPRILLADHPLHIVQRGINREPCFFADEDYLCYLHWLEEVARDCGCAVHAYALMTNHVHLLLTPSVPGAPSRLMQSLGRRYVQYANRFYKRTGSLWEGRYKSGVVQAESYLLACMRYIELNPVRAGMVADPAQYRWSSYRGNGLALADSRLTAHAHYLSLGSDGGSRCIAYRALFRPALDQEATGDIRSALKLGMPLGNARFAEAICRQLGVRLNSGKRGRLPGEPVTSQVRETEQSGFGF